MAASDQVPQTQQTETPATTPAPAPSAPPQGAQTWDAGPERSAEEEAAADALLDAPPSGPTDEQIREAARAGARSLKTGSTEAPKPAAKPGEAKPAEPAAEVEGEEEAQEPPKIEWNTLEDVQAALADENAVPAEARPYLEAAMSTIRPHVAGLESAKLGLEQSTKVLRELAQKLEANGAEGAQELADNYTGILQTVDAMSDDMVKTSWELLQYKHPEIANIPADHPLQVAFRKMLAAEEHFTLFKDDPRYITKLEKAFELCAFRTKSTDLSQFAPKPPVVAEPPKKSALEAGKRPMAPTIQGKPAAPAPKKKVTGGSIVADGSIAPTPPRRSIDEMSVDELMDQHEHLL